MVESNTQTSCRPPCYWLLGLPVDHVRFEDAQQRLIRAAFEQTPLVFVTPNLNFLRTARRDPVFRGNAMRNELSLVDGMPLVWLARLLGQRFERVAGSTLFDSLADRSLERKLRVFFFGGPDGAAAAACANVNRSASGLQAVGALSPGFGTVDEMSTSTIIDTINASGADFVVVALGSRKGLAWIEQNRFALRPPVVSHLGAVVNFTAGTVKRAPRWLQRLGLEWMWRTWQEPTLASRYAADAMFVVTEGVSAVLPLLVWNAVARLKRNARPLMIESREGSDHVLFLSGSLTKTYLPALMEACERNCENNSGGLVINLDGVDNVDCRALGYLYELTCRRASAGTVAIVGGGRHLRRLMRWHRADVLLDPSTSTADGWVTGEAGT